MAFVSRSVRVMTAMYMFHESGLDEYSRPPTSHSPSVPARSAASSDFRDPSYSCHKPILPPTNPPRLGTLGPSSWYKKRTRDVNPKHTMAVQHLSDILPQRSWATGETRIYRRFEACRTRKSYQAGA
ncbi:hypothetical protein BDW60DRAFT_163844 [Aspergillus nidulans var. acristatus]